MKISCTYTENGTDVVSIEAVSTKGLNPFKEYPQLNTIWPQPYLGIATEVIDEHFAVADTHYIGAVLLIKKEGTVIGITGFVPFDNELVNFGLRWHGVVPEERGKKHSEKVLEMVAQTLTALHPTAQLLTELVPQSEYGRPLEKHFQSLGFKKVGEPEKYDWSDDQWQGYSLDIAEFLASRKRKVVRPRM